MLPRYIFLGFIAVGATGAAVSFIPGDTERLAMLERDDRHPDVMRELDARYSSGTIDDRSTLRLYNLKLRFGLLDEAQQILEGYARQRPRDLQAQLGLVRFYQTTQQEDRYVQALRGVYLQTRSREIQNELLGYYRLKGLYREEEALLESAMLAQRASPADHERLGLMAAAHGDLSRAARALRAADRGLEPGAREAPLSLFRVLLEIKAYEEAHRSAIGWLRTWRDPDAAIDFMEQLAVQGRLDLALDIGGRYGGAGSEVTLLSAEMLAEQNKPLEARARLNEYQALGLPEERERAERLIELASDIADAELALRAARHIGFRRLGGEVIVSLVAALHEAVAGSENSRFPRELLKGLAAAMENRIVVYEPLDGEATDVPELPAVLSMFLAQAARDDGDLNLARRYLASLDVSQLDKDDLEEREALIASIDPPSASAVPAPAALAPVPAAGTTTRTAARAEDRPPQRRASRTRARTRYLQRLRDQRQTRVKSRNVRSQTPKRPTAARVKRPRAAPDGG